MLKFLAASSVLVAAKGFEIACDSSKCPETCTCSQNNCAGSIDACLADGECSKVQDCAMQCACGDEACLLECAGKTSSPLAMPVAQCIQTNCPASRNFLKAQLHGVDCSAANCQEACECSMDKCGDSITSCLADSECSKVQDCAMGCDCGDDTCMLACAKSSTSPLAEPVATCVASECHVASRLLRSDGQDLDCSAAKCQDGCECSKEKCGDAIDACLADDECSKVQDCGMNCKCGDYSCMFDCAKASTSPLAASVASCVASKCHQGPAMRRSIVRDIDCTAANCQEACECSKDKCGDAINTCLADGECAKVQDCAMGCDCGDDACMLSCAKSSTSPLAEPVATCVASNCHVEAGLLRSSAPNLSCNGAACEDACRCGKKKCLGVGMACLLDPQCSAFQACSFQCPCGDAECAFACAGAQTSTKAMPLAQCITDRCHTDLNV